MPTSRRRNPQNDTIPGPSEPLPPEPADGEASDTETHTAVRATPSAVLDGIDQLRIARHAALADRELLPNVHQCIAQAMTLVKPVGKEGTNSRDGYKFKRIDDFMDAANGALGTAGVHIVPKVLKRITDETHRTSSNNVMRWIDLKVRFRFYGPRGDFVDVVTWGEGRDASDKATNKALTAAMKYALMYALMIPTSDIQDADRESPEAGESRQQQGPTPAQEAAQRARDEKIRQQIETATADAETVASFRHDALVVADRNPVGPARREALNFVWKRAGEAGALGCEVTLPAPWQAVAGVPVCTLHQLLVGAQNITVDSQETAPPAEPEQQQLAVEQTDPWATQGTQTDDGMGAK